MFFRNVLIQNVRNLWKKTEPFFGKYNKVKPGTVSKMLSVPDHIEKPQYYKTGIPAPSGFEQPEIKDSVQIDKIRKSCRLASRILREVGEQLRVGQTTDEIDKIIHNLCITNNAYPSPLNYKGFPKSVCTSVNNVACHGIPDDRPLEDGDIINIDITVYYNGYHGDCSRTFLVGNVDPLGVELTLVADLILEEAIDICGPGEKFCAIGNYIQHTAKKYGYNVIPSLIGHGIGTYFHGPPDIYHCDNSYPGRMQPGMTFTIEPALTHGSEELIVLEDGWTAITADNARSVQAEHTILITENGAEVLTIPTKLS